MRNLFLPSVQNGDIYEIAAEVVEEIVFLKNSMEEVEEDNAKDQFLKSVQMEWKMKIKRFELEIGDHNQDEKQELNDNIFALETKNALLAKQIQECGENKIRTSSPIPTQSSTKWINFVFLPIENSLVDKNFSDGKNSKCFSQKIGDYCNQNEEAKKSTAAFIFESSDEDNEEDFDIDDFLKKCSSTHLLSSS